MWLILRRQNGHAESLTGPVIQLYATQEEVETALKAAQAKYPGASFYLAETLGESIPRGGYEFVTHKTEGESK